MADAYYYSSSAERMALVGSLTGSATSMTVDLVAGLPSTTPFKVVVDPGTDAEEIVKVTAVTGTTLTIVRGWDGTVSQAHANLAEVRHMVTAEDLRLSRQHESAVTGVHGVTSPLVGTTDSQTLLNKNLTSSTNVFPASLATDAEVTAAVNSGVAAHSAATGAHGVTGAVVGTNSTQTLTAKTMSGSDNTFTNIPQSAIASLSSDQTTQNTRLTNLETRATSVESRATSLENAPVPAASAAKDGKKLHWGTFTGNTDSNGYLIVTHSAGFTPTVVKVELSVAWQRGVDTITATTFRVRILQADGTAPGVQSLTGSFICGE